MSRSDFLSAFKCVSFNFPSKVAVCCASEASSAPSGITYCELNRVTDDLSQFFFKLFDRRQYIAVRLTDRFWLFTIILSIWKSGNAFSGLPEHFTEEKNEIFLKRLNIRYVITDIEINHKSILNFWINQKKFTIWETNWKGNSGSHWDMCYGIMTSGSTGIPKVVQVPWSCIMPNAEELKEIFKMDSNDVIYQSSPCTFDPFFIDLFLAFTTGASLVFSKYLTDDLLKALFFESKINNSLDLNRKNLIEKNENQFICDIINCSFKKVTFVQITPSLFLKWGVNNIQNILLSLRILVFGGEKFPKQVLRLKRTAKIYNIYGITEISCWAFINEIKNEKKEISIGQPLNGILYKINAGELFIGSKSRKCLVDDEEDFSEEKIVYRATGDVVKIIDEEIHFVCRNNQIIKRFGVKVDLSKIENEFLKNEKVKDCRCLFADSNQKLILFLVFNDEEKNAAPEEILEKNNLMDIEKPDRLIRISSLPINPNGKCDSKKLLMLAEDSEENSKRKLTFKEKFHDIWTSVLQGEGKNFRDAGGNSVTALLLTNKMDDANIDVPKNFLQVLFQDGDFENCLKILKGEISSKKFKMSENDFSLDIVWKFDFKKCIDASPVVAKINGRWYVIVGSHSSLLSSVEMETGIGNWTINLGDRIESGCCINKSCTLGFVGCYDHFVYCLSLLDGKIIWKYKTGDMVKSTPCLSTEEETVFVASYDTYLHCLSCLDGALLQKLKLSDKGIYCRGIVDANFKSFYIGTLDGTCVSINQNANTITWKKKLTSPIFASPCLHSNLAIFIEVMGRVQAFSADAGVNIWTYELNGNVYSSPVIYQNYLLFGCHDRCLYCLKIEDGPSLEFRSEYDSPIFASPRLIKIGEENLIAVVSMKGLVYLSNFDSGDIVSNFQFPGEIFSTPCYRGNQLIVGCRDNHLYCLMVKNKKTKLMLKV